MKFIGMGDNVVDRYVNKKVMFPGGNAVNFAAYAKLCGVGSAYLGVFANDREGRLIRSALSELWELIYPGAPYFRTQRRSGVMWY